MYIPSAFRNDDAEQLADFIDRHGFATLVTHHAGETVASHLPMLLQRDGSDRGQLIGHLARANPQWHHFESPQEVLTIFHGPHCYVSPTWYTVEPAVPTWNYAVVHVYGRAKILHDERTIRDALDRLVAKYESHQPRPWSGELPEEYRNQLTRAIVAFQIEITRIEGKFKLSQNRSEADRASVFSVLSQHERENERQIGKLM